MKRKMIALVLSLSMVLGMSMSVSAASTTGLPGEDHATHSNNANAVVSSETDRTNSEDDDYDLNTQFYINVDKDATSGEVEIPDNEIVPGDGITCHYELGYSIARKSTIKVTVPLYVCMYGYGGDGKIVTPTAEKYQMKNESTYTQKKILKTIMPCYAVTVINKGDTLPGDVQTVYHATEGANDSGKWGYYKAGTSGGYKVVELSKCDLHTDTWKTDKCTTDYFFRDNTFTENSVTASDGKTYVIGQEDTNELSSTTPTPLTVNIPTVKAENQSWKLIEMKGNASASLKAGELCMSINGLDLSKAELEGGLDIRDLKWSIEGGRALNLPIQAVMAGGCGSEDGGVAVVLMIYSIAPDFSTVSTTP